MWGEMKTFSIFQIKAGRYADMAIAKYYLSKAKKVEAERKRIEREMFLHTVTDFNRGDKDK